MSRIKYMVIIAINTFTGRCVVNLFGSTYIVAGNFVQKVR